MNNRMNWCFPTNPFISSTCKGVYMTSITFKEMFGVDIPGAAQARPEKAGLPYSKKIDFVFSKEQTTKLIRFFAGQSARNNLMIIGPAGAGKTAVVEQCAARLGWPLWAVSCSGKVRASHWFGTFGFKDGKTVWEDGPLTLAMRNGGIFLADEVTRLDAAEQMSLVRILDGGAFTIPDTGETIVPHKLFRFVATGNSGGFGDDTGSYTGERVSSYAFIDRFLKMSVSYISEELETQLLEKAVPALNGTVREVLVKLAGAIRAGFSGSGGNGGLRIGMSTRSLLATAKEAYAYQTMGLKNPLIEALNDVILNGAPEDDVTAVRDMVDSFLLGK